MDDAVVEGLPPIPRRAARDEAVIDAFAAFLVALLDEEEACPVCGGEITAALTECPTCRACVRCGGDEGARCRCHGV